MTACRKEDADAYGNFEATEVTVAAEVGGRLLALKLEEGDRVSRGTVVGAVDTVPLILERRATAARRAAAAARAREANATIASLEIQQTIADRDLARTERLLKNAAATAQQGDRAEREARVVKEQLAGARVARGSARSGGGCAGCPGGDDRRPADPKPRHEPARWNYPHPLCGAGRIRAAGPAALQDRLAGFTDLSGLCERAAAHISSSRASR